MDTEYLTLKDWAEREGISPSTVRHRIARGSTQATKLGRDWMISVDEKLTDGRKKKGEINGR